MGDNCNQHPHINMSIIAKLCLLAITATVAEGWEGCTIVGTCVIDDKERGTTKLDKVLHNLNEAGCHAKAADEFKRCGNGDEFPITATLFHKDGTSKSISFPKRKGNCYHDWPTRMLPTYMGLIKKNNTPSECNKKCAEKNFSYFGVEIHTECWCGNEPPKEDRHANEMTCERRCPGDPNLMCGGN